MQKRTSENPVDLATTRFAGSDRIEYNDPLIYVLTCIEENQKNVYISHEKFEVGPVRWGIRAFDVKVSKCQKTEIAIGRHFSKLNSSRARRRTGLSIETSK
jgi:hypothetical protein